MLHPAARCPLFCLWHNVPTVAISSYALEALDRQGYVVIDLIGHDGAQAATLSRANRFIAVGGRKYWAKVDAQQGLVAELVAGRLAARIGAGPDSEIVRVAPEAIAQGGPGEHLTASLGVGSADLPDTINTKDLPTFLGAGSLPADSVDPRSRTLVTAFRSWLGVGDPQVLVNLKNGSVHSIDHGDCFASLNTPSDPIVDVASIHSISSDLGRDRRCVDAAVAKIASVSDHALVDSVSRMPVGGAWRSPVDRRLRIAEWLSHRRDRMEEVMNKWLNN